MDQCDVTRHDRVVSYDYDEVALLTECNFRKMPTPRNPLEELSDEPWFGVGENDIFPEEFERFLHPRLVKSWRRREAANITTGADYQVDLEIFPLLVQRKHRAVISVRSDWVALLKALAGLIPREEHNRLLRVLLPRLREREARRQDRMRVVFEGGFCEQPPLDLLRSIAQFVYVVDDDLLIGLRWLLEDVEPAGDPLANLAEAYIEKSSYSPVQHDLRKPKEKMLLRRIEEADAGAAIVAAAKMCEPGLDEQVAYSGALDEAGIPYFVTEFEESMTAYDHLQIQLETFVENLLFE